MSRGSFAIALLALTVSAGCYQKMGQQPRYDPLEPSAFFADGSFVHLVATDNDGGDSPLPKLEAFRKFQADLKERLVEQPQVNEAAIVGDYRMLGA